MGKVSLGNFGVRTRFEVQGSTVKTLKIGSASEHRAEIVNRTTLPYDVELNCVLPDPVPPRALSCASAPADAWTVRIGALGGSKTSPPARHAFDVHGPATPRQRVHVVGLRYRLSTAGVPLALGGLWQSVQPSGLPAVVDTIDVIQ